HDVAGPELALLLRAQVRLVALLEARLVLGCLCHQRSAPHFLQTRIFLPSSPNRYPMRVGPHLSQRVATLAALIGMSLSVMPACIVAFVWRWCFLATLTPSTMTRFESVSTRVIAPSFPTSLPVSTRTRSPLRSLRCTLVSFMVRGPPGRARRCA